MKHLVKLLLGLSLTLSAYKNTATATANETPAATPKKQESPNAKTAKKPPKASPDAMQIVLEEYKKFVSKIPPKVRDEIVAYRKEIASINKRKKTLYKELSTEAQSFLKQEQQFRKKLPLKERKKLKLNSN